MAARKKAKKATAKPRTKAKAKTKKKAVRSKKTATRVKVKTTKAKKKAAAKTAPKSLGKVSDPFTKTELLTTLAERTGLQKKEVSSVIEELGAVIEGHLKKSGPGQFTLPGMIKMVVKKTPARKARKGINPFTGEPTIFKAKPASRKVKITALKKVKEMALA